MLKNSQGKNTREGFQFLGAWSQLKAFWDCCPQGESQGPEPRICTQRTSARMRMLALILSPSLDLWDQSVLGTICPPTTGPDPPALCSESIPALQHSAIPPANPAGLQQEELLLCAQRCPRAQLPRLPKPAGTRTSTHFQCIPE